jgi:amino acid adenylation domain-containing protein
VTALLHERLTAAAEAGPDDAAVVDRTRSIAYGHLERRANRLAHLLLDHGVSAGDRVGLYLDKSLESLVAIYAVLKAGAAYVPFDPQAPEPRLGYIAGNAGIRCLLTGIEKAPTWRGLASAGASLEQIVVLNAAAVDGDAVPAGARALASGAADEYPDAPPPTRSSDDALAYILYTSGSTGEPKGVMLTHSNALAFVDWAVAEFGVGAADRLSSHAPLHFDLSVFDLFAASSAGACVVLVPGELSVFPPELARLIEASAISVWYSVPSVLSMLVQHGDLSKGRFPGLRLILFAGEVFPTKHLFRLMELLPHVRFYNLYGPTETNVCTWYEVPPPAGEQPDSIPIGRPIANVDVFAVRDDGQLAASGEVGELYVRGPTVMRGYWGDADKTARALVRDRLGGSRDAPLYSTGDLVRQDGSGHFEFLGRRDAQIKSRGYRIELGEIESALYAHPAVGECAVVAVADPLVTNRIKAYVATREPVEPADLLGFCRRRIPAYMVPESVELRPALPKTSTGKIDRRAL